MTAMQSLVNHHPDLSCIEDYVAGRCSHSVALVIATHIEYCPECALHYQHCISRCGEEILNQPPEDWTLESDTITDSALNIIKQPDVPLATDDKALTANAEDIILPKTIQQYCYESVHWRAVGKNLKIGRLIKTKGSSCNLFYLKQGGALPTHTHHGQEYLMVLSGDLADENGIYRPGDMILSDHSVTHTPYALSDCLCIAATDAPVHFTGKFGKMMNLLGMGRL